MVLSSTACQRGMVLREGSISCAPWGYGPFAGRHGTQQIEPFCVLGWPQLSGFHATHARRWRGLPESQMRARKGGCNAGLGSSKLGFWNSGKHLRCLLYSRLGGRGGFAVAEHRNLGKAGNG